MEPRFLFFFFFFFPSLFNNYDEKNMYLKHQFGYDLNAAGLSSSSGQDTMETNNLDESSDVFFFPPQ